MHDCLRQLLVLPEKGLDGKIFTEFVALILISRLDHKIKESDLHKNYTLHQLLDKLDVDRCTNLQYFNHYVS